MQYTMIFFAITTLVGVTTSIHLLKKLDTSENKIIDLYIENEKLKVKLGSAPEEITRLTIENVRLERELQRKMKKGKK